MTDTTDRRIAERRKQDRGFCCFREGHDLSGHKPENDRSGLDRRKAPQCHCELGDSCDVCTPELAAPTPVQPAGAPYLANRADGVNGHYCIGRTIDGTASYWNPSGWFATGYLFFDKHLADAVLTLLAAASVPVQPEWEPMVVFTATGDGAGTWLVPAANMLQEFHDQHCCVPHEWQKCDTEGILAMTQDVANDENWSKDYPDYSPHVYTVNGEDYSLTIARLANRTAPAREGK